ncbi:histone-lysine N-methyltransferase SETDB1-A [Hemibagrus wyckioides]|uniref:histone-lysine N-methyltransferase SETDB1-A n=1 Tax=Hemibagrus wyckioides TaxID=337641 RepID=UPI00266B7050|nr:histone-lysine N-methyltransferase SETDB1-A [Hemibagrus wyckioides]XP_058261295.1 histone-lysine N-methyltransferase SETDB1-A [Hemibagrus wyckioides]XP_058261296.1 histone-lysine N-methyltransferase SETDB1-A [Hemibagrus wyckioides]XP_058261297.1 histone-lysine N-methyltransferase SETDB1-A [Hemibagrus wyckioides]XP_058261298.1 histone-lysine N-methyltransferase SETDB1-A [Hemibagrus wyckioides]XP_058261299.1 histone-lysine N-methyltransferase SETDB1-A [Hemibagrus wyckioides]XP_058261300.1 hi
MNSEEEDERMNMTEEELQHWVRSQVEKNEQLAQRRTQLAQVEEWVKRKEREATYTQLLYNNACESVLECESVIKGLYGMLGLEYRDTDSEEEEEEEEEEGDKPQENVIQIADDCENGEDKRGDEEEDDDDYVVIDLGATAPETALTGEELTVSQEADSGAAIESSESPVPLNQKGERPEAVDPPAKVKPSSSSAIKKQRSSDKPIANVKTLESSEPITAPSSPPASSSKSIPVSETVEPTAVQNTSSTSDSDPDEPETPTKQKNVDTPAQPVASTPASELPSVSASKSIDSVNQKPASKSNHSNATSTSDTAGKTKSKKKKKVKRASPKPSRKSTPTRSTVKDKPAAVNPKQGDKPEAKSSTSSPNTNAAASENTSKKTTPTDPPDAREVSQKPPATPPVTPPVTPVPDHVQQEVELNVNMKVLGRRRTKTWHPGMILDIKTTETGPRCKILFDGGKGKSILSAHHLACVDPPMLKDLFVGCRVVACYKEDDQSWLHAAVVAEMPDRRNRMRFLVFFDNGRPAYIALPDLHLVCKPLKNMSDDIEDKVWRAEVEEYLQAYPNPIFVVMRVGQDSKVERNGNMELCTVTQVDGSLIQICYKKDQEKEWLFKGSNRLQQIQNIKKRMSGQKKDEAVNKAGSIVPEKNTKLSTNTTTTTTSTTSTASSTPVTTNPEPLKSSTSPGVSQTETFPDNSISQPRVVLKRVNMPLPLTPVKVTTHTEPAVTTPSNTGTKRPAPEEEDCRSQNALLPVVEPRLKYAPHRCCPACLDHVRPTQRDGHRGQNPLLIPLLHGFRRMTARRRLDKKMSFHVFYRAPCGRSMCEMEEIQAFLFESRCDFLFLDMFCLDPFVLVKRATLPSSMVSSPFLFLPDISQGKESVPVQCVNELNTVAPPPLTYTRHRVPAPGVFINTSLDFMVGCDCTDGCRDRSKCACYQMTIEATSLFTGGPVDVTAGYTHKRLPRYVPTGVYECNALCRCDPTLCSNRLVQHGLQLRMEVFMTQHKGWGLRCLDDMSKGTFVCVFTGKVVKDEVVNTESGMSGNEYLANLDYIEGVEKLKEGYESEAHCSDKEDETDKKTRVTMTTGALKKKFLMNLSSSSNEEKEDTTKRKMTETKEIPKSRMTPGKREREAREKSEHEDDPVQDVDYKPSETSEECNRSYTTRRNTKLPEHKISSLTLNTSPASLPGCQIESDPTHFIEKESQNTVQTSAKISEEHTEVTASMAKKMRKEGPGGPKTGFARKSTRAFAIKSTHRRVKPLAEPEKRVQDSKEARGRKCTRSLFNGEKSCYLLDAKQEGNLARYINHSCSPNLFVQNVFVDTHDLRFPWVAFFTSKRIRAGTELTWDYSYEVGSVEGKVLLCCCGSCECTGRLL